MHLYLKSNDGFFVGLETHLRKQIESPQTFQHILPSFPLIALVHDIPHIPSLGVNIARDVDDCLGLECEELIEEGGVAAFAGGLNVS